MSKKKTYSKPKVMKQRGRKSSKTMKEWYKVYKEKYQKKETSLNKKGESMKRPMIMSYDKFRMTFESVKATKKEQGTQYNGKRGESKKVVHRTQKPSYERIIDTMVTGQAFDVSPRQAQAMRRFLRDAYGNEKVTIADIESGRVTFSHEQWEDIKKQYHQLKNQSGYSAREAQEMISETIFGSK